MKLRYILQLVLVDSLLLNVLPFIILFPLGLILVPIALLFNLYREVPSDRPIQFEGWKRIQPYKFFAPWANEVGWMGDHTWINNCPSWTTPFSKIGMFLWTIRNPVGGWDKVVGLTLNKDTDTIQWWGDKEVGDDSGNAGWHFVRTKTPKRSYMGFYLVWQLPFWKSKCLRLRVGYKVKPTYINISRPVDVTPLSISIKNFNTK